MGKSFDEGLGQGGLKSLTEDQRNLTENLVRIQVWGAAMTDPANVKRKGSDTRRQEDHVTLSTLADHRLAPASTQPSHQGRLSHITRLVLCS